GGAGRVDGSRAAGSPEAERGIRLGPPRFGTVRVKQYRGEVRSARAGSLVHWPLAWEGWSGRPEGRVAVRRQQKAPPERGFFWRSGLFCRCNLLDRSFFGLFALFIGFGKYRMDDTAPLLVLELILLR